MDKQNDETMGVSAESEGASSLTEKMPKEGTSQTIGLDGEDAHLNCHASTSADDICAEGSVEERPEGPCCGEGEGCEHEKGSSDMDPHELGRRGEKAARLFLERRGHEILDINWTCFAGEVDIVSIDDDTLCFIEVKTRRGASAGFPEEAVTARKRCRYEKIAACYLKEHDFADMRVRFDVISIMVIGEHRAFLRMHTNAFGVDPVR